MSAIRHRCGTSVALLVAVATLASCAGAGTSPSSAPSACTAGPDDLAIVGRIVTMAEPPIAEALLIEGGTVVAIGAREAVTNLACEGLTVIDLGENVAYPGFIDAHAHWINDRDQYDVGLPAEAMLAAVRRGWTSISEQWISPERLTELETLASDDALLLRVDAYLALNYDQDFFGDWYLERNPGAVGDRLRVRGVKIHLDTGSGGAINWEPDEFSAAIGRANDAGWQVSVHALSADAQEILLDAYEAALGPSGPNPLHHRIEHALQVTDDQLARMVAMDIVPVIQLDGATADWVTWSKSLGDQGRDFEAGGLSLLARWRDFVDAGLHVAASTDMPYFRPGSVMADAMARPHDQIASGMDGRGRAWPGDPPSWVLDNLLTAEEGLRALTADAAWALGDEARRGHLAGGALGDVTILSGDVLHAAPGEIRAMEVIATIVGGEVVFCADSDVCG
jgi:predicted amidohydrolase YtcJ